MSLLPNVIVKSIINDPSVTLYNPFTTHYHSYYTPTTHLEHPLLQPFYSPTTQLPHTLHHLHSYYTPTSSYDTPCTLSHSLHLYYTTHIISPTPPKPLIHSHHTLPHAHTPTTPRTTPLRQVVAPTLSLLTVGGAGIVAPINHGPVSRCT